MFVGIEARVGLRTGVNSWPVWVECEHCVHDIDPRDYSRKWIWKDVRATASVPDSVVSKISRTAIDEISVYCYVSCTVAESNNNIFCVNSDSDCLEASVHR